MNPNGRPKGQVNPVKCKRPECKEILSVERIKNRATYCCTACQKKHHYSQRENRICKVKACKKWFNVARDSSRKKCWSCDPPEVREKAPKTARPVNCLDYIRDISGPGKKFHDHRTTHCKRETHVKGNFINCAGYCECSYLPFKVWRNKAVKCNCYQQPTEAARNTLGGSFAQAVSQGYTHTG